MTRRSYVERSPGGPREYVALFASTFGPVMALRASLAERPERLAAFDRDFEDFAAQGNQAPAGAPAEYPYDYLLVVARR